MNGVGPSTKGMQNCGMEGLILDSKFKGNGYAGCYGCNRTSCGYMFYVAKGSRGYALRCAICAECQTGEEVDQNLICEICNNFLRCPGNCDMCQFHTSVCPTHKR